MKNQLNIQILFLMLLFLASCANSVEEVSKDGKNSPVIVTSSNIAVDENQLGVVVVLVSDLDGTAKVSVKISGGADSSLFVLSGNTLRFIETPDFENPRNTSATEENTYEVELTAIDGSGLESKKLLSVAVLNLNDNAPILTSPSYYKIPENRLEAGAIKAAGLEPW